MILSLLENNKIKEERQINKKQEFKFLGSGRYKRGLTFFAYDYANDKIYKPELIKKTLVVFKSEKASAKYKVVLNPEHYMFWALNMKNAIKKVAKYKNIIETYNINEMAKQKYTEKDLEDLINSKLDGSIDCNTHGNLCRKMETKQGRNELFENIKQLILKGEYTDVDECLTHFEIELTA